MLFLIPNGRRYWGREMAEDSVATQQAVVLMNARIQALVDQISTASARERAAIFAQLGDHIQVVQTGSGIYWHYINMLAGLTG